MKRYSEQEIDKIKLLRRINAFSFSHLGRITGIPQTTIRNWCYDEKVHTKWDTLRATNERRRQEFRDSELNSLSILADIQKDLAKVLAAIIYWCEGSKYPATNGMVLVNSDAGLLRTFISLLRKAFPLDESKFRVHLQIHDTHDFEKLKKYWSETLSISPSLFIRPTITSANGKKHRNSYFGTCSLKYGDYSLQLKLIGLYEAFTRKIIKI